jgi:hypothetical protein
MAVLFLDFDGVLHPVGVPEGPLCFSGMETFVRLLELLPDVEVVLSTSWRQSHGLEACLEFFPESIRARIVDANPYRVDDRDKADHLLSFVREAECHYWMEKNRSLDTPWLALDDDAVRFSPGCSNLYLTNPATGLMEADFAEVLSKLEFATQI